MKRLTKKILITLYYYHPYVSGVSINAKRVAEGLAKRGHKVTVLTSRFDKTLPQKEVINGVEVIRRPVLMKFGKGVIMPTFWLDILRYARAYDYINPHLPMNDSAISSLFISKDKIITTYQCDIFLGNGLLDRLLSFVSISLMKLQLNRSKVVISSSMDYLEHSKMKKYAYKAQAIGPTITVPEFHNISSTEFFNNLKVQQDEVKIGFVGRIVYEKGINFLLDSMPYLNKSIKKYKIVIVGDYSNVAGGSIKDQLDNYIKLYPDKIIFTGYLSDKDRNRFYSGIDVLVLPSIDPLEAYGMVQIEAMLCGTPVVASNLPGVRQIVRNTGYGRICKTKNAKDIANQIVEVVINPHKYKPNRDKVAKMYDPQAGFDIYESLMP